MRSKVASTHLHNLVQMASMSPTAKYGCSYLQDVIKRSVRRRTPSAGRVASRRVSPCGGWRSKFNPTRRTGAFSYVLNKVWFAFFFSFFYFVIASHNDVRLRFKTFPNQLHQLNVWTELCLLTVKFTVSKHNWFRVCVCVCFAEKEFFSTDQICLFCQYRFIWATECSRKQTLL